MLYIGFSYRFPRYWSMRILIISFDNCIYSIPRSYDLFASLMFITTFRFFVFLVDFITHVAYNVGLFAFPDEWLPD